MIWRCPLCRAALLDSMSKFLCSECRASFEVVAGIPDLRISGDSWIDFEDDLASAREISALNCSLPELVRLVYANRPNWDADRISRRTREVLEAPAKLQKDIRGWLAPVVEAEGVLLDLGCGGGMLIASAASTGKEMIGIDVSMTWLVVAKRLVSEFGGKPILAAALGEALPLKSDSIAGLVSLDVIEHVRDPDQYLREINRVVRHEGVVALSTPNRFSLTAEPHVFVWGVGWLPVRWQSRFVRWRSGKSYDDTCLMSSFGLWRRLHRNTSFRVKILIPQIPEEHLAAFRPAKGILARLYNRIASARTMRFFFLLVGPFFRVIGVQRKLGDSPCAP